MESGPRVNSGDFEVARWAGGRIIQGTGPLPSTRKGLPSGWVWISRTS